MNYGFEIFANVIEAVIIIQFLVRYFGVRARKAGLPVIILMIAVLATTVSAFNFIEYIRSENTERILNNFEIGSFENDSDYIVLKMKQTSELYKTLGLINKGLRTKYGVVSEYSYTPHISLAELQPGTAKKYLEDPKISLILNESFVSFEDLVISYGPSNTPVDRLRYNLTTFNAIDYFFHTENMRKENSELD